MLLITCRICKREMRVWHAEIKRGKKYCSRACSRKGQTKRILKACLICGKEYFKKAYKIAMGEGKTCSWKCMGLLKAKKISKSCGVCHEQFWTVPAEMRKGGGKYCSQVCYHKTMIGSNNGNWKGGITALNLSIRGLPQYTRWREAVLKRDEYRCQECGEQGIILDVDHIIPFIYILRKFKIKTIEDASICKLLWDISNGRSLCKPCHWQTPTHGTRANNFSLQYL